MTLFLFLIWTALAVGIATLIVIVWVKVCITKPRGRNEEPISKHLL